MFLKIKKIILTTALIFSVFSFFENYNITAQGKVSVEQNKNSKIEIKEYGADFLVSVYALKDLKNVDVRITIDDKVVYSYTIDNLKQGGREERIITRKQLEEAKRTLPNTKIVKENLKLLKTVNNHKISVEINYNVEEAENINNNVSNKNLSSYKILVIEKTKNTKNERERQESTNNEEEKELENKTENILTEDESI